MKTPRPGLLLWLIAASFARAAEAPVADAPTAAPVLAPAAGAAKAPPPPPLSPRFIQVRNRIDALYRHRTSSPAPLDPRQNPFRPAGVFVAPVVAPDGRTIVAPIEQSTDETLLRDAVALLKVGGVFEVGKKQHRVVNGRPYKEGDVIPAQLPGQTVYLRIKALSAKSMTLGLKEAETTINF
jgi:hypothetical protein